MARREQLTPADLKNILSAELRELHEELKQASSGDREAIRGKTSKEMIIFLIRGKNIPDVSYDDEEDEFTFPEDKHEDAFHSLLARVVEITNEVLDKINEEEETEEDVLLEIDLIDESKKIKELSTGEVNNKLPETINSLNNLFDIVFDALSFPEDLGDNDITNVEKLLSQLSDRNIRILFRRNDLLSEIGPVTSILNEIKLAWDAILKDIEDKTPETSSSLVEKKGEIADYNLDITIEKFVGYEEKERKIWIAKSLKLFINSEIYHTSERSPGAYLKKTFDQALTFLENSEVPEEVRLAKWVSARLQLSFPAKLAGVRYGLSYDDLLTGGTSLKDNTTPWEGLGVEGTTFSADQLGMLLGKEGEINEGDSKRLEFIIDVIDAWFSGERFPSRRKAMYSNDLRVKFEDQVKEIHKRANRRDKSSSMGEGYFLAMNKFDNNLKGDIDAAIKEVWDLLYEDSDDVDEEDMSFSLAGDLITFLDIRNIRAQDQYAAAASPIDEGVQKTIKASSLRMGPGVVENYADIGKGAGGSFNPALALGKLNKRVEYFLKNARGKGGTYWLKYRHSVQVMKAWLDWYAPIPKEFVDGLDKYEEYGFYESSEDRERYNPFPRIGEYYYFDLENRRRLIEENTVGLENFGGYLQNAKSFEAYIKKCLDGAKLSVKADLKKNPADFQTEIQANAKEIVKEVSGAISATKGMILGKGEHKRGIDGYYVARAVYIFCRQLILQFAHDKESGLSESDYIALLAYTSKAVWNAVRSGGTMDGIHFFSPEDNKTMSIMEYVTNRIPNPTITKGKTGRFIDFTAGGIKEEFIKAIGYDNVRQHNNKHHVNEFAQRGDSYLNELKQKIKNDLLGRTAHSHYIVDIAEYGITIQNEPGIDPNDFTNEFMWGGAKIPHNISGDSKTKDTQDAAD